MAHSFAYGKSCYLSRPEWQAILIERQATSKTERLFYQILGQMAFWPGLAREISAVRSAEDKDAFSSTFTEVLQMRTSLQELEPHIKRLLDSSGYVVTDMPISAGSPMPNVYKFGREIELCRIVAYHAMLLIVSNRMLALLDPVLAADFDVLGQNFDLSRRIWMLHEDVRGLRPCGYFFYVTVLLITLESAQDQDTREWIITILNEVQGRTLDSGKWWDEDMILSMSGALYGRWPMEDE